MIDYLDEGNAIYFDYLMDWSKQGNEVFKKIREFNLGMLLSKVYNLFVKMPPVSFEELFGQDEAAQPAVNRQSTSWNKED